MADAENKKKKTKRGKKASAGKGPVQRRRAETPVADNKTGPTVAAIDSRDDQIRSQEGSNEGRKEEKAAEKKRPILALPESEEREEAFWTDALFIPEERLIQTAPAAPRHIDEPALVSPAPPSVVSENEGREAPPQALPESAASDAAAAPPPPSQDFAESQDTAPQESTEKKETTHKAPRSLLGSVAPAPLRPPLTGKVSGSRAIVSSWFDDEPAPSEQESQEPIKRQESPAPPPLLQELAGTGYSASPPPDWREPAETVDTAAPHAPLQAPVETVDAPAPPAALQEPAETVHAPAPPAPLQEPAETVDAPAPPGAPQEPVEIVDSPAPPMELQNPVVTADTPAPPVVLLELAEIHDAPGPAPDHQRAAIVDERKEKEKAPVQRDDKQLIWAGAAIALVAASFLIFLVVHPLEKTGVPSVNSTQKPAEQAPIPGQSGQQAPLPAQDAGDQAVAARASQHEKLGQYNDAYADYSVLIAHQPQARQWYLKRAAVVIAAEGDLKLAKADVDTAISTDDKQADAHVLSGDLNVKRNLFKDALVDYSTALKLQPGDASIQQKLATAKLKLEQMPQAKVTMSQAPFQWAPSKELVEKHPINVAYQLMVDGQPAAAAPILAEVIKKEPNNLLARRYLAWSASDSQMPKTACEQFKVLDRLNSLNAQDLSKFAVCLEQVDAARAPAMFERAVQADPQNGDLREGLCHAYIAVKDYARALAAAREGIRFAKDDNQRMSFEEMIKTSQQKEL